MVYGDVKQEHKKNHKLDYDGPVHRHWQSDANDLKQNEEGAVI